LAKKIGISERSLYDYLKIMKDMGAPVSYSRDTGSYYYKEYGQFRIAFIAIDDLDISEIELSRDETKHCV
jgi:predicted DNA-binding transcriptional regulator YafY